MTETRNVLNLLKVLMAVNLSEYHIKIRHDATLDCLVLATLVPRP